MKKFHSYQYSVYQKQIKVKKAQSALRLWGQTGVICLAITLHHAFFISVAYCPLERKYKVPLNYDIYPFLTRSVCFSMRSPTWWSLGFCSSGNSLVFSDVTHQSCSNFKWENADINKEIPIDFRAVKCLSVEYGQRYRKNISYVQSN